MARLSTWRATTLAHADAHRHGNFTTDIHGNGNFATDGHETSDAYTNRDAYRDCHLDGDVTTHATSDGYPCTGADPARLHAADRTAPATRAGNRDGGYRAVTRVRTTSSVDASTTDGNERTTDNCANVHN